MGKRKWFEEITVPDFGAIYEGPFRHAGLGKAVVTNGHIVLLIDDDGEYEEATDSMVRKFDAALSITEDHRQMKARIESLRELAGDYIIRLCDACNGGFVNECFCPECHDTGYIGMATDPVCRIGECYYNQCYVAGIVNCVPPGVVDVYLPPPPLKRGEKVRPMIIEGETFKAAIAPVFSADGLKITGTFSDWING